MTSLQNWEIENAVSLVDTTKDALYSYDTKAIKDLLEAKPWKSDPHYFKHVRISATALIKMVIHARSGGNIEVMGLMLGHVQHETFIVTDALRLPVEGTETRVNAQSEADEYAINYLEKSRQAGQVENAVGWYHSHPGYGCWLSGIDVSTEDTQQMYSDPFLAVVIDPDRTISAGKVEIGAFRTFPAGYEAKNVNASSDGSAAVPLAKAQDFGAHANRYYSLEVSHFKSSLDSKLLEALWNKYWVQTLSASPLFTNHEYGTRQIQDLAGKLKHAHDQTKQRTSVGIMHPSRNKNAEEAVMQKLVKSAERIANEEKMGLMAALVKEKVFVGQQSSLDHTAMTGGHEIVMNDAKII